MSLTGIGEIADFAKDIANKFLVDKTQQEKDNAALAIQALSGQYGLVQGQIDVDKAEAASTDRWQHWRGALGWVCSLAYAWNFLLQPMASYSISLIAQHFGAVVAIPGQMDIAPLSTLTMGMLGLGGLHVFERVKGAS